MRVTLDKLMEKLGVGRTLSPYETQPWVHYDADRGLTCSAEVRMGPGGQDVEAEIQFLKDETDDEDEDKGEDEKTQEEEKEDGENDGEEGKEDGEIQPGGRKQILHMRALPVTESDWSPKALRVQGEDYAGKIHDWEGKGCSFFQACIMAIQMGEVPDIEELVKKELADDKFGGGRRGKIGRKSPKVKPGQLMGMKK